MKTNKPSAARDITRITLGVVFIGLMITASLWVLLPFVGATVWATMIVVATWPIMIGLQARLGGRRGLAVTIMTLVMLLLLVVPLVLAVSTVLEYADNIAELVPGRSRRCKCRLRPTGLRKCLCSDRGSRPNGGNSPRHLPRSWRHELRRISARQSWGLRCKQVDSRSCCCIFC